MFGDIAVVLSAIVFGPAAFYAVVGWRMRTIAPRSLDWRTGRPIWTKYLVRGIVLGVVAFALFEFGYPHSHFQSGGALEAVAFVVGTLEVFAALSISERRNRRDRRES
ncbi:MAG TPA: hypothetical protein VFA78_04135 [Chloroflexota bacterium]|nr:hypothetical protein [Chloroflexota bacterium]